MIDTPKIYKMRVVCAKPGTMDHRQFFNRFRDMVIKSGLNFAPAKINKAWPRLAYGPVPGYAQASKAEYVDIYLRDSTSPEAVYKALEGVKAGLDLKKVTRVPYALPSVSNLAEVYQYSVEGDFEKYSPAKSPEAFLNSKSIVMKQVLENGFTKETDLKPFIRAFEMEGPRKINLVLQKIGDKNVKPEYVIALWLGMEIPEESEEFTIKDIKFIREALFWRDGQGALHAI